MRKHIPTFASIVVILLASLLQSPLTRSQATNADETTFIQLQHDWAEARKKGDIAFLDKFYASEFTVGLLNGAEASRAEDMEKFSSGDLKPSVITDTQLKVNIYGQAALVTGLEHLEGTYKGHSGQFDLRFANVYVFRDSRWQLVRHQATPLSKN